jgi:hypothetical protein
MRDTWPQEKAEVVHLLDDEVPDGWGAPDVEPLPPIRLPALAEVAAAARSSHLLERVRRLAAWVGWERPLTSTEVLTRADAKAVIADLNLLPATDPRRTGVTSARDVPELHRLWVIAEDLEWIQLGAATRPKAVGHRSSPPEDDGEAMSEWYDALLALLDPGSEAEFIHTDLPWKDVLPPVLAALYAAMARQEAVRPDTLTAVLVEQATGQLSGSPWDPDPSAFRRDEAAEFVASVVDVLGDLGAVTVDGTTVTLTPIGVFGLRYWLVEAGFDAPITGELTEVDAQELVQRVPACDPATAEDEVTGWLALRTPVHAAEDLLGVMRSSGPGPRGVAGGLLVRLGADAEPAVRAALADPTLRRYATAWLEDRDLPAPPLTESDRMWLWVDTTAGFLDDPDPEAAIRVMANAVPTADEVLDRVRRAWQSEHPATEQVLAALGRYHPDARIAEQASATRRSKPR